MPVLSIDIKTNKASEVPTIAERINELIDGKSEQCVKEIFKECFETYEKPVADKKCPTCGTLLEEFEGGGPDDDYTRYTCSNCGVFVDITEIEDDEVLELIGYSDEDDIDEGDESE